MPHDPLPKQPLFVDEASLVTQSLERQDFLVTKKPKPEELKLKQSKFQEAVEQYKQEVLEGLQIEEEGLTDYIRKKSKQPSSSITSKNYNDPFDSLQVDSTVHKNGQVLKSYETITSKYNRTKIKTDNKNHDSEEQLTTDTQIIKKPRYYGKSEDVPHKRKKRHERRHRYR